MSDSMFIYYRWLLSLTTERKSKMIFKSQFNTDNGVDKNRNSVLSDYSEI